VGQTLTIPLWGAARIVGAEGHVRHWGLADYENSTKNRQAYASVHHLPDKYGPIIYRTLTMIPRAQVEGAASLPSIQELAYGAANELPIYDIRTMQEIMRESITSQRFPMFLLGAFALLALLLATVGIYGVITYMTTERTHEIGVRLVLGADRWSILRMVVR